MVGVNIRIECGINANFRAPVTGKHDIRSKAVTNKAGHFRTSTSNRLEFLLKDQPDSSPLALFQRAVVARSACDTFS